MIKGDYLLLVQSRENSCERMKRIWETTKGRVNRPKRGEVRGWRTLEWEIDWTVHYMRTSISSGSALRAFCMEKEREINLTRRTWIKIYRFQREWTSILARRLTLPLQVARDTRVSKFERDQVKKQKLDSRSLLKFSRVPFQTTTSRLPFFSVCSSISIPIRTTRKGSSLAQTELSPSPFVWQDFSFKHLWTFFSTGVSEIRASSLCDTAGLRNGIGSRQAANLVEWFVEIGVSLKHNSREVLSLVELYVVLPPPPPSFSPCWQHSKSWTGFSNISFGKHQPKLSYPPPSSTSDRNTVSWAWAVEDRYRLNRARGPEEEESNSKSFKCVIVVSFEGIRDSRGEF